MSSSPEDGMSNAWNSVAPAAEEIMQNLHSLRDQIVTAWRERAIILSDEEQAQLQEEIRHTCEFLKNLTMHP